MTILVQSDDGQQTHYTLTGVENITIGTNKEGTNYLLATQGLRSAPRFAWLQWAVMTTLPQEMLQ